MNFTTIDFLSRILLSPEQRVTLDLDKLNTLSTLTISPVSAMGNTTHLYKTVQQHHGLDLYLFQNYYYNKHGDIKKQSEMTIRINDSYSLTPDDKDWFVSLANRINASIKYESVSPIVEFDKKTYY